MGLKSEKINVLMAINTSYLEQMKTVICSLGINCSCSIDIYLMHTELSEKDIQILECLTRKMCNGKLCEIKINSDFLKDAKITNHFSVEMYYRIFASEFLPKTIDRVLWLDADLVVLKDLKEFFLSDFEGCSVICCGHREKTKDDTTMNDKGLIRLGMKKDDIYFNSGVLLMDLKKIRRNFNKENVLNIIYKKENILENPDQDILNLLYENDKLIKDWRIYNYQTHFDWKFDNEKEHLEKNAKILHFVGPFKPWIYTSEHFSYKYYWKYYFVHSGRYKYIVSKMMHLAYVGYMKIVKG